MTIAEPISLEGVRNLEGVLTRLPQGVAARDLAVKLGLWSASVHSTAGANRQQVFPHNFSQMEDSDLSDQNAYWLSEVFRVTELVGLLEGQRTMLTLRAKSTRASVRAQLRRKHRDEAEAAATAAAEAARQGNGTASTKAPAPIKDPSATQLSDEVEEDRRVSECDDNLAMLAMVLESAKAYKEACLAATAGLSREISFRQAQMGARLR